MNFPVGPYVPEKSPPLLVRKRSPDFLSKRTKRVDHSAPVAAHALRRFHLRADQPQNPANGARRGFIPERRPGRRSPMTLRQQAATRKNVNGSSESGLPQGNGDIHTG